MPKLKYNKNGEEAMNKQEAIGEQKYALVSGYDVRDIAELKTFEGRLLRSDWNAKAKNIWIFDSGGEEIGLWSCLDMDKALFPLVERAIEHDVFVRIEYIEKIEIAGGKTFKRIRVLLDTESARVLKKIQEARYKQQELPSIDE
jgi:hypothetical protein